MEASEDLVELEADNIKSISSFKENIAVFSRTNDAIFNHINIFDLKPDDSDLQISPIEEDKNEANSISIFDITKETQKLDLDDIKILTLKAINPNIDISKDEISTFDRKISLNRDEENLQMIIEDASYGLKNRRKGDKLSHDQIKF